jgi:hypothetical protein
MRHHSPAQPKPPAAAFAIFVNAIENVNAGTFDEQAITTILATGDGHSSAVRAVFGDVPLEAIDEAATAAGISTKTLMRAYLTARDRHAAINDQLEELLASDGQPTPQSS